MTISMVLFGLGMLLVTLLIHYVLFRMKKRTDFWMGTSVVFVMCVLGLLSNDVGYLAGILGYIIGSDISKLAGWC